ncbi:hypothetical protein SKAU_G00340290 [Synaphobranchus kaupii]|uniref:Uncharacterized protein n=1 Tax=Synaphobranchus kaupii TaxID=118154 RepID=A0A9Q1EMV5_SYNKA|nr:hypothetical protein SKAU_G00340290 [Synaphobranchus kaupii]
MRLQSSIVHNCLKTIEALWETEPECSKTNSLGQCVSVLSKRFAMMETFRNTLIGTQPTHRERRSEVRHPHRKDRHPQQEVSKQKISSSKIPTSILKTPNCSSMDSELKYQRKPECHVRFSEPESKSTTGRGCFRLQSSQPGQFKDVFP